MIMVIMCGLLESKIVCVLISGLEEDTVATQIAADRATQTQQRVVRVLGGQASTKT